MENWKSIAETSLEIDPLSVLIGTNASGKSNVLDALAFLNRISQGALLTAALQGDGNLAQMRGGLEWAARRPGDRFKLSATVRHDETTEFIYKIECIISRGHCEVFSEELIRQRFRLKRNNERQANPSQIALFKSDPTDQNSPTITARLYNEKRGTPRQLNRASAALYQLFGQKNRTEIDEGISSVLADLRNIFILDPIPSHMRSFSPFSEKLQADAGNIAGVLAAQHESAKLEIEQTLTKYVSKLPERDIVRVYAEAVGKFNSDAMLYCDEKYGDSDQTIDARGMSDGTLRFLAITTALLTRTKGSLLVVEEVDNGLHPSRSKLLLNMLREIGTERGVDVLVTTHNPALLDEMGTEMVPFITVSHRNPGSGATELTLLENIEELPRLLSQGAIGEISSRGLIESALKDQENEQKEVHKQDLFG
jgi:predicted ATPase